MGIGDCLLAFIFNGVEVLLACDGGYVRCWGAASEDVVARISEGVIGRRNHDSDRMIGFQVDWDKHTHMYIY